MVEIIKTPVKENTVLLLKKKKNLHWKQTIKTNEDCYYKKFMLEELKTEN